MKRFAFTMIELVFVIIVIAILAVLAMPNFNRDLLHEASEQVAGHMRYTQHLAMNDNKFDDNNGTWYQSWWRLRLYESGTPDNYYYTVFSDKDQNGNADYGTGKTEVAVDPLKHINLHVSNDNNDMDLTGKFGITGVVSTCDAVGNIDIFFDNLGRPYTHSVAGANPYASLLHNDCTITLTAGTRTAVITLRSETGYVSVTHLDP